ncbi:MAG TPA: hypothetical protein VLF14_12595 [Candidatus Binatia bacterium]|nr:hypothetical protein [Candidatus Binatia bacterium]
MKLAAWNVDPIRARFERLLGTPLRRRDRMTRMPEDNDGQSS